MNHRLTSIIVYLSSESLFVIIFNQHSQLTLTPVSFLIDNAILINKEISNLNVSPNQVKDKCNSDFKLT